MTEAMWNKRYAEAEGYLFGTRQAQFLVENPWILDGRGTALCVADGEGRNSVAIARAGWAVSAFDKAPLAVERARALAERAGVAVAYSVDDLESGNWRGGRFDLVIGIFIQVFGPPRRDAVIGDMQAATRPGGRLVLHGYRPEQLAFGTGGPPFEENMYTEHRIRPLFEGWRIERLASYDRKVEEGRGHSGMSALFDLVARKPA